jgi:hypothetical protein
MTHLRGLFAGAAELRSLRREVRSLREEVAKLNAQNERMRAGMRRCVTCEYRFEVLERN